MAVAHDGTGLRLISTGFIRRPLVSQILTSSQGLSRLGNLTWRIGGVSVAIALIGCSNMRVTAEALPSLGLHRRIAQIGGHVTPLGNIDQQSPNSTVYVEGVVQEHIPLVHGGLYQLGDDSGQSWVLTPQTPPALGTRIRLEGRIQYEPILVAGADQGEHYIQELNRLEAQPPTTTP